MQGGPAPRLHVGVKWSSRWVAIGLSVKGPPLVPSLCRGGAGGRGRLHPEVLPAKPQAFRTFHHHSSLQPLHVAFGFSKLCVDTLCEDGFVKGCLC